MDQILSDALADVLVLCDAALQLTAGNPGQTARIQRAQTCATQLQGMVADSVGFPPNKARMLAIGMFGAVELLLRGEEGALEAEFASCVRTIHSLAAQIRDMLQP